MRFIASKGWVMTATKSILTYCNDVGMAELQMLIDYDILTTMSKEVAEVHHLARALSYICALRPGSIGFSSPSHREVGHFLKWRDVTIFRGTEPGKLFGSSRPITTTMSRKPRTNRRCFGTRRYRKPLNYHKSLVSVDWEDLFSGDIIKPKMVESCNLPVVGN